MQKQQLKYKFNIINANDLDSVLDLSLKHKYALDLDNSKNNDDYIASICNYIGKVYPHFYTCCDENNKLLACCSIEEWGYSGNKYHSCLLSHCLFDRKAYGKTSLEIGKQFIDYIFKTFDLHKIKIEVYETNKLGINYFEKLGFKKEAILKEEAYNNNNELINLYVYSIIRSYFYV